MTIRKFLFFAFSLLLLPNVCSAQSITGKQMVEDLSFYKQTLPSKHKNLYSKITKQDFDAGVAKIAAKADSLNFESFVAELFKLNVKIGDEHTMIEVHYAKMLPILLKPFEDGYLVTAIDSSKSDNLLAKLVAINGYSLEQLNEKFKQVIKGDNASYFKVHKQQFLNNPAFLKGLGILSADDEAEFTLMSSSGEIRKVKLHAVGINDNNYQRRAPQYSMLLPYTHKNSIYFYEYDSIHKLIYFNYRSCRNDQKDPFDDFNNALFAAIDRHQPLKIVVDLRFNSGGNSAILSPFIKKIQNSYLNKQGKFYVLIGRMTFSSALMNAVELKRNTKCILVGETTGGDINHYGEVRGFELPNSKITIAYSTKYWETWEGKTGGLNPDKEIKYYSDSFIDNKDEALDYVRTAGE